MDRYLLMISGRVGPGAHAGSLALRVLRTVAKTRTAGINLVQLVRGTELNEPTPDPARAHRRMRGRAVFSCA
ncbi:hypothetical protein P3T22_006261 [Paraburkholderia sp. GAS348]|jgi:hypothetical protein